MLAMVEPQKQPPVLVEIRRRTFPIDEIAPQHIEVDADLEAWGRWSRSGGGRFPCGSVEGAYRPRNGNIEMGWEFEAPIPSRPQIANPRMREIDRALLAVPESHRKALILHYAYQARPERICRALAVNVSMFGPLMFMARSMVVNILRRLEAN